MNTAYKTSARQLARAQAAVALLLPQSAVQSTYAQQEAVMFFRKIRSRFRRYRHYNQPYYPGAFLTLDLAITAIKLLLIIGLFASLLYYLT